jgi:hypothetical protein
MEWICCFVLFWHDFAVADDWRLAVGIIVGLGLTAVLAKATSVAAWWVTPLNPRSWRRVLADLQPDPTLPE